MKQLYIANIICLFQICHAVGHLRTFTKATRPLLPSNILAAEIEEQTHEDPWEVNFGRSQQQSDHATDRKLELEDGRITNNSDDTRQILRIDPFTLTLRPTPSALTPEQISHTMNLMETLLMKKLKRESNALALISAVNLNDVAEVDYFPVQTMVRNGKALADNAQMAAYSIMKVDGGRANTTFSILYDPPTTKELNIAVMKILNENLVDALRLQIGFNEVEQVAVESYVAPVIIPPENSSNTPQSPIVSRTASKPVAVSLGAIAAVLAVLGLSFYAWKKGSMDKVTEKYSQVRSNLRMKSLKRSDPDEKAHEYLIEVGTDEMESPTSSPVSTPLNRPGSMDMHMREEFPSPNSIKSKKQRVRDRKTIDPADYVVEVGTE